MEQTVDVSGFAGVALAFVLIIGLLGLVAIVVAVVGWLRIFKKAGYNQLMGLLMFVPVANLIVFLVLAFGKWPIESENELLKGNRQTTVPSQTGI